MKRSTRKKINSKNPQFCDICSEKEFLVEHHIRGRKIPNYNSKHNLCYVCSNCHMKIHKGKIILEDWMLTTNGRKLIWHYDNEKSISGNDAKVHMF